MIWFSSDEGYICLLLHISGRYSPSQIRKNGPHLVLQFVLVLLQQLESRTDNRTTSFQPDIFIANTPRPGVKLCKKTAGDSFPTLSTETGHTTAFFSA